MKYIFSAMYIVFHFAMKLSYTDFTNSNFNESVFLLQKETSIQMLYITINSFLKLSEDRKDKMCLNPAEKLLNWSSR